MVSVSPFLPVFGLATQKISFKYIFGNFAKEENLEC